LSHVLKVFKTATPAEPPKYGHPAGRTDDAKDRFEWGEEVAAEWNAKASKGATDWRTNGVMVDGTERCRLASNQAGLFINEDEWYQVKS
jgi:hypothetical protein